MENFIDNDDFFKKEIDLKLMEIEKLKNSESKKSSVQKKSKSKE